MHQPRPLCALCLLVVVAAAGAPESAIAAAAPRASTSKAADTATKTHTMEIRVQDYSFRDGARDRPVIEVVSTDVKTSDLHSIMEAIRGADNVVDNVADNMAEEDVGDDTSWWTDASIDELSLQDALVLLVVFICLARMFVLAVKMVWALLRLPLRCYYALFPEKPKSDALVAAGTKGRGLSLLMKKQLAIIRFCHLQLLLVVDKLKHEMREGVGEDTQRMVASLPPPRRRAGSKAALSEILATLQEIQEKDSSFLSSEVEERLARLRQGSDGESEDDEADLAEAWARLQELYVSFQEIQTSIVRRQQHRKHRRWQAEQQSLAVETHKHGHPSHQRRRRLSSYEDPTAEVLQQLHELTKELPQGFTADMFTSLGNAMHEKMVAPEPEQPESPVASPQREHKSARTHDVPQASVVCADTQ